MRLRTPPKAHRIRRPVRTCAWCLVLCERVGRQLCELAADGVAQHLPGGLFNPVRASLACQIPARRIRPPNAVRPRRCPPTPARRQCPWTGPRVAWAAGSHVPVLDFPEIQKQRVISNGPRRLLTVHSRLAVEPPEVPVPVAAELAPIRPVSRWRPGIPRSAPVIGSQAGPRPMSLSSCPDALSADGSVAGIVRRGVPAVLASAGPAVDHRVPLAGFDADAGAPPERHRDLARPPRVPVRARGRVRPPDRKIVRQVAIIHRPIRTHMPNW